MQKVIERILNLLAFLLTVERPVTAEEIRYTVKGYDQASDDAFRRTFERDKDLLRTLGVPLTLKHTDVWEVELGYVIPSEEYEIVDPGLTDEERSALHIAAQAVRFGGQSTEAAAIFKLGGLTEASGGAVAADLGDDLQLLGSLFEAITARQRVLFTYKDRPRTVEPYGLGHRFGHWYLLGPESGDRDTVKAFRIDRLRQIKIDESSGTFTRPPGFRTSGSMPEFAGGGLGDRESVVVRFDKDIAQIALRQVHTLGPPRSDERGVTATIGVSSTSGFLGWLLGFDAKAEIIEPQELADRYLEFVGVDR